MLEIIKILTMPFLLLMDWSYSYKSQVMIVSRNTFTMGGHKYHNGHFLLLQLLSQYLDVFLMLWDLWLTVQWATLMAIIILLKDDYNANGGKLSWTMLLIEQIRIFPFYEGKLCNLTVPALRCNQFHSCPPHSTTSKYPSLTCHSIPLSSIFMIEGSLQNSTVASFLTEISIRP